MVSLVSKKVLRMIEMDYSDLRVRLNMLGVFPTFWTCGNDIFWYTVLGECHTICPSFVANSCQLFVNTCHVLSKIISAPLFQMGQWAPFDRTSESPSRSVPRVAGENTEVFHKIWIDMRIWFTPSCDGHPQNRFIGNTQIRLIPSN